MKSVIWWMLVVEVWGLCYDGSMKNNKLHRINFAYARKMPSLKSNSKMVHPKTKTTQWKVSLNPKKKLKGFQ